MTTTAIKAVYHAKLQAACALPTPAERRAACDTAHSWYETACEAAGINPDGGADAVTTPSGGNLHYYRPLAAFHGQVMKYAGMASPNNLAYFPEKCMTADDGYEPGLLILPLFAGDRIYTASLLPYDGRPPYWDPKHFKPGQEVVYGEFRATICDHYHEGMWNIRLPGGPACVSGAHLQPVKG